MSSRCRNTRRPKAECFRRSSSDGRTSRGLLSNKGSGAHRQNSRSRGGPAEAVGTGSAVTGTRKLTTAGLPAHCSHRRNSSWRKHAGVRAAFTPVRQTKATLHAEPSSTHVPARARGRTLPAETRVRARGHTRTRPAQTRARTCTHAHTACTDTHAHTSAQTCTPAHGLHRHVHRHTRTGLSISRNTHFCL